ncbi:recombination protein NinG [Pseudomonas oryzihabitans]|uniref:recombination protein NinG n=1 Tax=Pseudomonas oryzihabitans TaxID=47885 RepID=UPI002894AC01|nr:recombination protein NinG [Pseudomonas oryzihabitans]MDT3718460.1 recombination protein NinG [Pseudomonas oryzihabitans]
MTLTTAKPRKPKACSVCKVEFVPVRSLQKVCGLKCGLAHAENQKRKQRKAIEQVERREIRVRKQRLKSRADYLRETQAIFNQWIRLRDAAEPCISCGRHHDGQYHAGHYRTVASAPELRFEPLNVWKQCAPCNNHKSGDIVNYRATLVQKLGAAQVEWLEGPHEAKHYTIEDLQAIKAQYRAKIRDLRKSAA